MSLHVGLHHIDPEKVDVFTSEKVGGQVSVMVRDRAGLPVSLWFDSADDVSVWLVTVGEELQVERAAAAARAADAAKVLAKAGLD